MTSSEQNHFPFVLVSTAEFSRLQEAEELLRRRIDLALSSLSPEQRAATAGVLRVDELTFGQRYF